MPLPAVGSLRRALDAYPEVVERQGVEGLAELDRWYHDELPGLIQGRTPAHLTLPELERITEWKMKRGVWRGRNLALVRGNDPAEVERVSAAGLKKIPHPTAPIAELARLKGVGPATASAAVSAAAPHLYPFFDEVVAAHLPLAGPLAWTLSYYARYAEAMRRAASELGDDWAPATLERALWAHSGGKAGVGSG